MTARAGRVFPGMLASMLLAGSFLAAPTPAAADTQPRKAVTQEQRRSSGTARAQKSIKTAATKATAGKSAKAAARRRATPTGVSTTAFIDDGFRYTEGADGRVGWKQTGVASWYGGARWQGRRTSDGGRYDQDALTAAHATLPLGSRVRVTLANSGRSVTVTITDRPGTRSRIIDLSRGAARALGILSRGVAVVTLSPDSPSL